MTREECKKMLWSTHLCGTDGNERVVRRSNFCGCFYCGNIFRPNEITAWFGHGPGCEDRLEWEQFLPVPKPCWHCSAYEMCGKSACELCGKEFQPEDVVDDKEEFYGDATPFCPYCGLDTVLADGGETTVTREYLELMMLEFFGPGIDSLGDEYFDSE